MATRVRKSATERKVEIVDAVIRLSGDIGPDRLTTDRLATEIGISQPGIFRPLPTKGEIWVAVGQRIAERLRANASLNKTKNALPIDQLRSFVIGHLAFISKTPAIPAILFSRELHAENDKLRAFFAGLIANRQRKFAELIKSEISAGRFHETLNPDDAAYLILALIQGLAMRWSLNARRFDLVAEGERLLELQLDGFRVSARKDSGVRQER